MKLAILAGFLFFATDPGFKPLFNGKDLSGWTLFSKKGPGLRRAERRARLP